MQRGPLRPRSRPPLRPLAVCIKCTHGGLSMPAAGLTLKMRERARSETASSADLAFVQPGQRVASRDGARALEPCPSWRQLQMSNWKRERGGREGQRRRQIELPRHWFSQMSKHIFVAIFSTFRIWLTHWLAGRGSPVQAPGTVFIMVWLSSFALHATCRINKQQFPTVYWWFHDLIFVMLSFCFVCVFLFALIFIEFIARRVATSPAGGTAACASCGSCQLASVAFRQARVAQKFKDTEVLSLSLFLSFSRVKGGIRTVSGISHKEGVEMKAKKRNVADCKGDSFCHTHSVRVLCGKWAKQMGGQWGKCFIANEA